MQEADERMLELEIETGGYWVLVIGFNLSYQNKETILFTIDLYYGNLN